MGKLNLIAVLTMIVTIGACTRPGVHYVLEGEIYNGMTGEKIPDYTIELTYADVKVAGKVTAGKYKIDYLPSFVDYTITIVATGYRPFVSNNLQLADNGGPTSVPTFLKRDASLYPTSLTSPAQTVNIVLADTQAKAMTGTARFRPRSTGVLVGEVASGNEQWTNSLNVQSPTVVKTIANGTVTLAEGELVFGIPYDVTVFGVGNYAVDSGSTFVAGNVSSLTVTLRPITAPSAVAGAPVITSTNIDDDPIIANAELHVFFDGPVRLGNVANAGLSLSDIQKTIGNQLTVRAENLCNGGGGGGSNGGGCGGGQNNSNDCQIAQSVRDGVKLEISGNEMVVKSNWAGNASLTCAPTGSPNAPAVVYAVCYRLDGFDLGRSDRTPFVSASPSEMTRASFGTTLPSPVCVQVLAN